MAKDKRSRSRKPTGNKPESPSRSGSTDTAVRVPLPPTSPMSGPAPGDPSDHDEGSQADSTLDSGKSSQNSVTLQGQDASQTSEVPMLTDNGDLGSPQIQPGLGEIVEDSGSNKSVEDSNSPTHTDQSTSPGIPRPAHNLGAELEGINFDGSDEDMQSEEGNHHRSPSAAQPDNTPATTEPQESRGADQGQQALSEGKFGNLGSNNARQAKPEDSQEEKSKRLAAEKEVRALKADMEAQRQRFEDRAEAAKKRYERALEKAEKEREADKLEHEEKLNVLNEQALRAEVANYENHVETLTATIQDDGASATSDRDVFSLKKQDSQELAQAIKDEINAPMAALPTAPRSDLRPGSNRFLLAQYEYLLAKDTKLYSALVATADYADGRGDLPSAEDTLRFDTFKDQVVGMNAFIRKHLVNESNECMHEVMADWEHAAKTNHWGRRLGLDS